MKWFTKIWNRLFGHELKSSASPEVAAHVRNRFLAIPTKL